MANTLTNLTTELYRAWDVVSREQIGFLPAVMMDASAAQAAKDDTIRIPVTPASTAADITAGQQAPNTGDQTIGNVTFSISKSRAVPIRWNGEEQLSMNNAAGFNVIFQDQVAQGIRALVNEMEADVAGLYAKASRAAGPAGTNLFDSTGKLEDIASVKQILLDNGAPTSDLHLVVGSDEYVALQALTQLTNVNELGGSSFLRQAAFGGPLLGVNIHHSPEVDVVTAGTQTNTDTDATGYAVGSTTITLDSSAPSGTGTIIAGDVISFAGDSNKYVVVSGDADTSDGGSITIAEPGLKVAIPAAETAITTDASQRKNLCFSRNAIFMATRAPAAPLGGDAASDSMIVQDPRSGMAFEMRVYPEYRQNHYSLGMAWGYEMIKPEHAALLID